MDSYFILKFLHILCAVVVMGTGAGIAFFQWMAYRSKNLPTLLVTTRHVVLADWIFTAPAVVGQLITGVLLMHRLHFSFSAPWFLTVISLFIFIGCCWIPVVAIQYKLASLAATSLANAELNPQFHRWMKRWMLLGLPAFAAMLVIFWLMVAKPLAFV